MRIHAQVIIDDLPVTAGANEVWEAVEEAIELRAAGGRTAGDWDRRLIHWDGEAEIGELDAETWAARLATAIYDAAPAVRLEISTRRVAVKRFHRFSPAEARRLATRPAPPAGR